MYFVVVLSVPPPRDPAIWDSGSKNWFKSGHQVRDCEFLLWILPSVFQSHILNFFCWYKLGSTLDNCPSILPLGTLGSIDYLHNSLWARSSWLPLQHYQTVW